VYDPQPGNMYADPVEPMGRFINWARQTRGKALEFAMLLFGDLADTLVASDTLLTSHRGELLPSRVEGDRALHSTRERVHEQRKGATRVSGITYLVS
jgi:hypothetical protein